MPHVDLDGSGNVTGLYAVPQSPAQTFLDDLDAKVIAYLNPPSKARDATIDVAIAADTTITQIKAMDSTTYDAWWTANVTTAAQAITILKRIVRVVIRRLL